MNELQRVLELYHLTPNRRSPTEIPGLFREDLAKLFHTLGYRVGAEIGTERGRFAKILCDSNPGVKLYCVDAWTIYDGYRCRSQSTLDHEQHRVDGFFGQCRQRLRHYDVEFVRKFSVEAAKDFADESLDFVYIDANHELLPVIEDLTYWSPKVRKGGIISGHDFMKTHIKGALSDVAPAVFAFTWAHNINPWFVMGTQKETEHLVRGRARSFFWIKS